MCAVIKRGILGGFANKIGNVVGSSWKGIATMRSLPLSVANPRTALQLTQRSKFSIATKLGSDTLVNIVKQLWDRFAQQESGFNAFVSVNVRIIGGLFSSYMDDLVFSRGTIAPSNILSAVVDASAATLAMTWDTTPVGDFLDSDRAYVVVLGAETIGEEPVFVRSFASVMQRNAGSLLVNLDGNLPQFPVRQVYLMFRRVDGSKVSNSLSIAPTIVP